MKATITSTLVAGALCLCVLVTPGRQALAQIKPEAVRPDAANPSLRDRSDRAPTPRRPDALTPSEDAPSAQEDMPMVPGACPDQGRKLQLIV